MANNEKGASAKIETFHKSIADMLVDDTVQGLTHEDLFLYPTEQSKKLQDMIRTHIQEYEITIDDYLEALDTDTDVAAIIALCIEDFTELDFTIIQATIDARNGVIFTGLFGKIETLTHGKVTDEDLYKMLLEGCNDPIYVNNPLPIMLAKACTNVEGITQDKFFEDYQEMGLTFPFDRYTLSNLIYYKREGKPVSMNKQEKAWWFTNDTSKLLPYVDNIENLEQQELQIIYDRSSELFNYVGHLKEDNILKGSIKKHFETMQPKDYKQLFNELLTFDAYENLVVIENNIKGENSLLPVEATLKESVQNYFAKEYVLKNYTTCNNLLPLMQKSGIDLPETEIITSINNGVQEEEQKRSVIQPYGHIDLLKNAARLYLSEWEHLTIQKRLSPPPVISDTELVPEPLEFKNIRDQADVSLIEQKRTDTINETFDWLKKYLVVAISSELTNFEDHTHERQPPQNVETLDIFNKATTTEEIRKYAEQATWLFNNYEWNLSMGGPRWGKVADLTLQAWNVASEDIKAKMRIIDIAFDLYHNGGNIFDKDPDHIDLSERNNVMFVLSKKFRAESFTDLLNGYTNGNYIGQEDKAEFEKDLKILKRIETAPTSTEGYE